MTAPTRFPKWPDFEPMFDKRSGFKVPPYLLLLNLDDESRLALDLLKGILKRHHDLTDQIVALISDMNWRPQLVAAVSMALGCSNPRAVVGLWQAFDCGSWVSQIGRASCRER